MVTTTRGSNTLFADIFEETTTTAPEARRKGRSPKHNARRNECLIDRYYYYGKYEQKRYSIILETLSEEFFLSPVTIPEVLTENFDQLDLLKRSKPGPGYFKKKWPHLVW